MISTTSDFALQTLGILCGPLQNSNGCYNLHREFQRLFHNSLEIYFRHLKWVFFGFSFTFLVCEICLFEATYVCTQCDLMYHNLKKVPWNPYNISKDLPYLIGNIFLSSKMGIFRFLIYLPGLWDMLVWSNLCLYTVRPHVQQLQTSITDSKKHIKGSTIAHWKYISVS